MCSAYPPDMCEPQTWEAHRGGWLGRRASAPSSTAPHSSEWAWRSSVDDSSQTLSAQVYSTRDHITSKRCGK